MTFSTLSINQLRKLIITGKISALDIAKQTLQDIAYYNPILNAWTEVTYQRMITEAEKIDQKYRNKETLPILAGIPYAVKNLFDVSGHTTLVGSKLFANRPVAYQDAWVIHKLKRAGAILSGMLNMDAYAYGFTTENSYYGATHNPHDISRIAGGSSGGSAAAVASGLVHFSLGTDTNGSIRVPASLCGTFALKPTFGRLSRRGVYPFVTSLDHVGHFARNTEDLALVYDVLQGRDSKDIFQINRINKPTFPIINKNYNKLRCALLTGFFTDWCDHLTRNTLFKAANSLNTEEEIIIPEAGLARSAAFIITATEGGHHYLPDLCKSPEYFEPLSRERLLAGAMIPTRWYLQAQRFRRYFYQRVSCLMKKFDILIAPATPCCATTIGQTKISINGYEISPRVSMGMLTQPISFIGLPVCIVPFNTPIGLPIGIQLIGKHFREDLVLRASRILEDQGLTLAPMNIKEKIKNPQ
ncbi:AtzE family amidohydrolase [Candidatus Ishikawella capsulata]|uniref:Amidase n=1 Tax=Candidatus Ishikawaella capsulata Mpkobe TaxID=476281 RepID=C5WDF6_9ENTR|nr:AtzE family amidohydrolase [Candidatus Ishikawaella capsulata]BAH83362.1 amidase [Candidatus Ishikawaella capsulata Mpkobe]